MKSFLLVLSAGAALVLAPAALASHSFPADVPDSHPFHTEIGIFKDANITTGCTATAFCPSDYVRRQAMAAFIDRALGLLVRPGEPTQKGVPGSRVAMLDDDLSFAGTVGNAFAYRGPDDNVVGGSAANSVTAGVLGATIAGGGASGGYPIPPDPNSVSDHYGSVGGGLSNLAGDSAGTTSDLQYATVAGGIGNWASGSESAVGGGRVNRASGLGSAVAGGYGNRASGRYSAVAGGYFNEAFGDGSFAAGRNAHASTGSFVFGDGNSPSGSTYSPAEYSFHAHATGGVHFHTNASGATTGCWIFPGGGSWSCSSDRNVKENFRPVDGKALLERVAKLPISSWNYKGQNDRFRHIGPMSQDFKAAFSVGEDDKSIAMVDADGVALAAIQALDARDERLTRENAALERDNAAMKSRLAALERSVATLMREEDR